MTTARHSRGTDETPTGTMQIGAGPVFDHADNLGGRLPLADPATLTGAQREAFDQMMATVVPFAQGADYELYAQSAVAAQAGLPEAAIATLVGGGLPDDLTATSPAIRSTRSWPAPPAPRGAARLAITVGWHT